MHAILLAELALHVFKLLLKQYFLEHSYDHIELVVLFISSYNQLKETSQSKSCYLKHRSQSLLLHHLLL